MKEQNKLIETIEKYAEEESVPIMQKDGINYLEEYIKKKNIKNILEIGTAIGYSAIRMALIDDDITVTTIERDRDRYLEAVKNVKAAKLEDRINLIFNDAFNINLTDEFDLIFIDAAKAQSINFFEKFEGNLVKGGTILTDNMHFHGLVFESPENIESRNVRQLVRKINKYREFLEKNKKYNTRFYDFGDGIAVSVKK